jgi:DNA-binding response OmpR family regulator
MKNQSILALVVSNSGAIQNGLLALMTTFPQISAVLVADDVNSSLRMVENHKPALVILDISLPEMQLVIGQLKEQYLQIHLILLVEDIEQKKEIEEFQVDHVFIKGFSAKKFIAVIENLIECQKNNLPAQDNIDESRNSD